MILIHNAHLKIKISMIKIVSTLHKPHSISHNIPTSYPDSQHRQKEYKLNLIKFNLSRKSVTLISMDKKSTLLSKPKVQNSTSKIKIQTQIDSKIKT